MPTSIIRPAADEFPEVYQPYMSLLPEGDVLYLLEKHSTDLRHMFSNISDTRAEESYAPGKWTMKELLQHLIDAERIFSYRALCIARGERQELPGFDENMYAYNSLANIRLLPNILEEYEQVRRANLLLFRSFTTEMLDQTGICNGNRMSVRVIIHVLAAHEMHHINILQTRYLKRKD
ncbi:DinB family protein [Pontibacter liquoris]|uniref:DinB family protein n=1 Tax=Pontibacter liquoris TaxID=2905677 RepID=UPI001FA7486F|nr:DinB family protein [Pontibacter liquoris]